MNMLGLLYSSPEIGFFCSDLRFSQRRPPRQTRHKNYGANMYEAPFPAVAPHCQLPPSLSLPLPFLPPFLDIPLALCFAGNDGTVEAHEDRYRPICPPRNIPLLC